MPSSKINKIRIKGDKNINLQDIYNSTITINTDNRSELYEMMEELHKIVSGETNNVINIFVVTTNRNKLAEKYKNKEIEIPLNNYKDKARRWQPFNDEGDIIALLADFQQKSSFIIEVYILDEWWTDNDEITATIVDDIAPRSILIADTFALDFKANREFCRLFDDTTIGGCIIPVCEKHNSTVRYYMMQRQKQVFRHINTCFYKRFNKEYMHLEPCIRTKEEMFRRLTNIAVKHLKLSPDKKINWNKKILEKEKGYFNHLKISM